MAETNLERVQNDLHILRRITGADFPYEWSDVRMGYTVGFASVLPLIAGILDAENKLLLLASALPFLLTVVGGVIWTYLRSHPRYECPALKRRYCRVGIPVTLVVVLALFGFHEWAVALGTPAGVANGAILVFLGLLLLIGGLSERVERHNVPMGILAIAGGLLWPLCEYNQFWVLIWALAAIGILTGTAILHWQMLHLSNRTRSQNGTD